MEPWPLRAASVDLHIHTNCSDGALSPAEIVRESLSRRLRAIAITDHDTIAGNQEALEEGTQLGIAVLAGVEISTHCGGITFHLLGYGMKPDSPGLRETFNFLEECRLRRNPQIVERLRALGLDVSMEEILAEARGSLVGRPHFARVLLKRGIVRSIQEAFDRFLGRGAAAYVDKVRLAPTEALHVIHGAGGIPVLAHPGLIERDHPDRLGGLIDALLPMGLGGIEAYYSRHTPEQTLHYLSLALRHGLVATGGSDFHQFDEVGPNLGTGFGNLHVPYSCYGDLAARLGMRAPAPFALSQDFTERLFGRGTG